MKKIAVINRTNFLNFGSVLQIYALCETVKSFGCHCDVIWEKGSFSNSQDLRFKKIFFSFLKLIAHPSLIKRTLKFTNRIVHRTDSENTAGLFRAFIDENISRRYLSYGEMKKSARTLYDKLICGSDQVWCSTGLYVDPLMYLRFAPKEKRISYAPSIGREYIPPYNARMMKQYIQDIPFLSVREHRGKELLKELLGRDVPVVLDPTLLMDKKRWDEIKIDPTTDDRYILCYFLDEPSLQTQKKIERFAGTRKTSIFALCSPLEAIKRGNIHHPDCGPAEFIGFVANADYVITDSYHGMLFSIIYRLPFAALKRYASEFDQSSRQRSVLKDLQIDGRFLSEEDEFPNDPLDYSKIEPLLVQKKEESLAYLRKAIEGGARNGAYG